jgi:hypothetical protein
LQHLIGIRGYIRLVRGQIGDVITIFVLAVTLALGLTLTLSSTVLGARAGGSRDADCYE